MEAFFCRLGGHGARSDLCAGPAWEPGGSLVGWSGLFEVIPPPPKASTALTFCLLPNCIGFCLSFCRGRGGCHLARNAVCLGLPWQQCVLRHDFIQALTHRILWLSGRVMVFCAFVANSGGRVLVSAAFCQSEIQILVLVLVLTSELRFTELRSATVSLWRRTVMNLR